MVMGAVLFIDQKEVRFTSGRAESDPDKFNAGLAGRLAGQKVEGHGH